MGHDQGPLLGTQAAALLKDAFRDVELAQVLQQRRISDSPLPCRIKPEILGEPFGKLGMLSRPTMHRLTEFDGAGECEDGGLLHLP